MYSTLQKSFVSFVTTLQIITNTLQMFACTLLWDTFSTPCTNKQHNVILDGEPTCFGTVANEPACEFINYPIDELTHEPSLIHNLTHEAVHDTQENIVYNMFMDSSQSIAKVRELGGNLFAKYRT